MGDKKFLTGDAPKFIDFYFFEAYQNTQHITEGWLFKEFPRLEKYNETFKALPKMADYLANKSIDKDYQFNNKVAKLNGKAAY